jgi:hypothetical protein
MVEYAGSRTSGRTEVLRKSYAQDGSQIREELLYPPPDHLWEEGDVEKPSSAEELREGNIFDWGAQAKKQKLTNLARAILWNYKRNEDYVCNNEKKLCGKLRQLMNDKFSLDDVEIDEISGLKQP